MSVSTAAIAGIVAAVAKYVTASKLTEKAVENASEAGGDALVSLGKAAHERIKQAAGGPRDVARKVKKALVDVEEDPEDEDYRAKLTKELERLAETDEHVRRILEQLAVQLPAAGGAVRGVAHVEGGSIRGSVIGLNLGSVIHREGGDRLDRPSEAGEGERRPELTPREPFSSISTIPVLAAFASAKDTDRLDLLQEARVLQQTLEAHGDAFDLRLLPAATIDDLCWGINEHQPRILHFSGHGRLEGLVFEEGAGKSRLVPRQALVRELATSVPPLTCVVLNACWSDVHAPDLSLGVPYVIAMRGRIDDAAAIEFTRGFYVALAAGADIPTAFEKGRNRIDLKDLPDSDVPVLVVGASAL